MSIIPTSTILAIATATATNTTGIIRTRTQSMFSIPTGAPIDASAVLDFFISETKVDCLRTCSPFVGILTSCVSLARETRAPTLTATDADGIPSYLWPYYRGIGDCLCGSEDLVAWGQGNPDICQSQCSGDDGQKYTDLMDGFAPMCELQTLELADVGGADEVERGEGDEGDEGDEAGKSEGDVDTSGVGMRGVVGVWVLACAVLGSVVLV